MGEDASAFARRYGYLDEAKNEPLRRFLQVIVAGCHQQLSPKASDTYEVQKRKLGNYFPCIVEGYETSVKANGGENAIRRDF